MINVIQKYQIIPGPNELIIPLGARVVHFGIHPLNNQLNVWMSHVPVKERTPMVQARLDVITTGQEYDTELWEHFGSVVSDKGFVWHLLTERLLGSGKAQFNERVEEYVRTATPQ